MNKKQISQAITGIAKLLVSNPELLAKQLTGLKALLPDLNESAIRGIVEKTKEPGFDPHDLEEELGTVVSAVKAAKK